MTNLILAHDAGGAEVLSSYVKRHPAKYVFCLKGPAETIFRRKLGEIQNIAFPEAIDNASEVLCGTGWESSFEFDAIKEAKNRGIKVCAILDHWVNYKERFIRDRLEILPDKIYVCDTYAEALAKEAFNIPIELIPNYYIEEIIKKVQSLSSQSLNNNILYLCEPIKEHIQKNPKLKRLNYDEYSAFDYFTTCIDKLACGDGKITIRLHPSEDRKKFETYVNRTNIILSRSENSSLDVDIANHGIIIGCDTMALYVAAISGKKAISCIPPGGAPCSLPSDCVVMLREL